MWKCFTWNSSRSPACKPSVASFGSDASAANVNSAFAFPGDLMFGVADYGAFVVAIIIFLAIPGPGNLALITSTGKGGIRGGLAATLGVIAGDQVLMWAAVAGVAALLLAYPAAFHAVQWLGAAYLAWLGAKMLLAK